MWTEQFASMLWLMIMAALLKTSFELSRPRQGNPAPDAYTNTTELQPWQNEASAKAVRKYAEAQEKKWRHWDEAMFELVK